MKIKRSALAGWGLWLSLICCPLAQAIEPEDVRAFEEVFLISAFAPDRASIEIKWVIAPGYYLYNNKFLQFSVQTPGVTLGEAIIPRGDTSFDELLGEEVEKYHGQLIVKLPILSLAPGIAGLRLNVRSQGCLEGVLCYPPTNQVVLVGVPADPAGAATESSAADPYSTTLPAALAANPAAPGDNPLTGLAGGPGNEAPALDANSAFVYEAIGLSAETALVRMTAQPGYYLYRDKFSFRVADASGFAVRDVSLPEGTLKDDPEFGPVPVIYGQVEIPVRLSRPAGPVTTISLEASFQGCRDGDICYPPQSRTVSFEMPAALSPMGEPAAASEDPAQALAQSSAQTSAQTSGQTAEKYTPGGAAPPVSEQDRLARLLTENTTKAIFAFFIAGILLAFTPCVFPMIPILSGIIMGQGQRLTTARAFWLSLVYVLAMAVTYTLAGVLAGLFGQNLQAVFQNPWILSGFVLIFVLLALSMFGLFELQLPASLQTRLALASNQQQGGQWWGVAVMGFLSALIVGPCVAPPLMAALIVIGASGDAVLGGSALFAMSLGMGLPLILFGISAGKLAPRAGNWMNAVKAVFGVGLLALAIWMLERILSGGVIMLLWGLLAIGCGVYLGALERIADGASGWKRLWKTLGVALLLLGALELVGAAAGGDYWLRPLGGFKATANSASAQDEVAFQRIKSLDDLDQAISAANAQGKGAMLDFYADWCVECLRMERNTFHTPQVQALLDRMHALQADVTSNDSTDQALMREFGIIGPPAILFFNRAGEEMKDWRLVGYFPPDEFARHLEGVLAAQ